MVSIPMSMSRFAHRFLTIKKKLGHFGNRHVGYVYTVSSAISDHETKVDMFFL